MFINVLLTFLDHTLKSNQEKSNLLFIFYNLTIMTEINVHFLIMKKIKEKTVPNLCTDFGSEHVLFLHCGYYSENEKFCFLKSRILTCRIFFLGTKLFCLCPNEMKFLVYYYFGISWILTKFRLIRTTFIFCH